MERIGKRLIRLDTSFLIAPWRSRGNVDHPARIVLSQYPEELLVVCIPIGGEFLEGAAFISEQRYRESLGFLHLFDIRAMDLETAGRYAHVVAELRKKNRLQGASKADRWFAVWALQHRARVASQNRKHFSHIPELELIGC
jgi:predicted nucleic acid-binding protein